MTEAGIDRLASLKLPRLRSLRLNRTKLGEKRALLDPPCLPSLRELSLSFKAPKEALEAVKARYG